MLRVSSFYAVALLVGCAGGNEGAWVTILKSIPFVLGEKVEFYPLGKDSYNGSNLLFELTIDRYEGSPASPAPLPLLVAGAIAGGSPNGSGFVKSGPAASSMS